MKKQSLMAGTKRMLAVAATFASVWGLAERGYARNRNNVHKFTCSGGEFYGVPLGSSIIDVPYIPVSVSGPFCTVYPGTRLTAGGMGCGGLRVEDTGIPVSQCDREN